MRKSIVTSQVIFQNFGLLESQTIRENELGLIGKKTEQKQEKEGFFFKRTTSCE